ncbi:MAG: DUF2934 domain-containing protein [Nitrospira sp.]|nr:DUF2934 domain-containing protein [Nitrospira sp.]
MEAGSSAVRRQQIAQRAYEFHAARGYRQGHEIEDWLEAEREVDDAVCR